MFSTIPVCNSAQLAMRAGPCHAHRSIIRMPTVHRGPAVSRQLRFSRDINGRRHRQVHVAAEQDQPAAESEPAAAEETAADSPSAKLVTATHDVLLERFQSAVDEDYADEKFLYAFIDDARAEFERLAAAADSVEAAVAAAKEQFDSSQQHYLRLNADFENFRKRSAAEKEAVVTRTKADVIEELLPVIDAFDAAAGQVKAETEGEEKIAASYQGLYNKLVAAFKKMGLEVVPGEGAPFDPEVHEAIMRAPSDDVPDGTVLQEFRKGFMIGKTLLRPAMVQVSFSEGPAVAAAPADDGTVIDTEASSDDAAAEEASSEAAADAE